MSFPENPKEGDKHSTPFADYVHDGDKWVCVKGPQITRVVNWDSYKSTLSGKVINTDRERKDDMKRNGVMDSRDLKGLPREKMNNYKG